MTEHPCIARFFSLKRWPLYLSVAIIVASQIFTLILNTINSLLWWGYVDVDLLWIGVIDSLVITLLIPPLAISLIRRAFNLEAMNRNLRKEIDERERMEASLREKDRRFRLITEHSRDMIWMLDMDLRFTFISPSVERMLGYSVEAYLAKAHQEILAPESLDRLMAVLAEELEAEENPDRDLYRSRVVETEQVHRDGTKRWIEISMTFLRDAEQKPIGILGYSRDITERKVVSEALRRSEARYQLLFHHINDVVYSIDRDLRITGISPSVEKYLGYRPQDLVGRSILELELIPPEDYEKALTLTLSVLKGETIESEAYEFLARDGRRHWAEVSGAPIIEGGEIIGTISVARDVTGRREAEETRRALEDRLQRAEKMEALGMLAGGVAHDLNNALGALVGYAELLYLRMDDGDPLREEVRNILTGGELAAAIVQDLLTLARRGVQKRSPVDLNRIVSEGLRSPEHLKRATIHPLVRIETALEPSLLKVSGSAVHLSKALMNLLSNAAEAMPQGGRVRIRTENRYLDRPVSDYDTVAIGEYAVLTVSDEGEGIAEEDLKRIFEPFYTKKVMGRSGTGLGLSVVWGTVKDHDGYIDVRSRKGLGTTFTLYFPVTRETDEEERTPATGTALGRGERILVVDDVESQRNLACRILQRFNYRVETAAGGEEALRYLQSQDVDLILLDMIMDPGIDGLETYRRILEIKPGQKAIIVSGYAESERVRQAQELGVGAYVRKPYLMDELGAAVRRALDRPRNEDLL